MRNDVSLSADVAIGAPFAGKDQRGKVLIYNGNKNGLNTKPSQILQGVWASQAVPSGFGFTLRGDSDIDKNDYPGKLFFLFAWQSLLPRKDHSLDHTVCLSSSLVQPELAHGTGSLGMILEQLSGESEDRQNKHSFSCQEMMLRKQVGFKKNFIGHKTFQLCSKNFYLKPEVIWSPSTKTAYVRVLFRLIYFNPIIPCWAHSSMNWLMNLNISILKLMVWEHKYFPPMFGGCPKIDCFKAKQKELVLFGKQFLIA